MSRPKGVHQKLLELLKIQDKIINQKTEKIDKFKIDFEDLRRFCVTVLFYCAGKFEPSSEPIRFGTKTI